MARRVVVSLEDDIDGGDASQSITFAVDDIKYEIDLSEANATRLRQQLQPWIACARRRRGVRRAGQHATPQPTASGLTREELRAVRAWAPTAGFDLAPRGRVPRQVLDAYVQAHG